MNADPIPGKLAQLAQQILQQPVTPVMFGQSRQQFLRWDSLGHVQLIMEVEDAFGVRFSPDEVRAIASLEQLCRQIRAKL